MHRRLENIFILTEINTLWQKHMGSSRLRMHFNHFPQSFQWPCGSLPTIILPRPISTTTYIIAEISAFSVTLNLMWPSTLLIATGDHYMAIFQPIWWPRNHFSPNLHPVHLMFPSSKSNENFHIVNLLPASNPHTSSVIDLVPIPHSDAAKYRKLLPLPPEAAQAQPGPRSGFQSLRLSPSPWSVPSLGLCLWFLSGAWVWSGTFHSPWTHSIGIQVCTWTRPHSGIVLTSSPWRSCYPSLHSHFVALGSTTLK